MSDSGDIATPASIGAYTIERELARQRTYLATGSDGRQVVLKILDPDCLQGNQLHPSVRERLARIRELAEKNVANLHGVERDGGYTFLVWDYIPGTTFADSSTSELPHRELLHLSRELVLLVESLHASGIVHGAISGGNVIIDPNRRLRLTHASPLLYIDPRHDGQAVTALLEKIVTIRRESNLPLGQVLASAREGQASLRELSGLLASVSDVREGPLPTPQHDARQEARMRRRALLGAALVTAAGLGVFTAINWYVNRLPGAAPTPLSTQTSVERESSPPPSPSLLSPSPSWPRAIVRE
ncbi:MAG TPA: protein kinase [Tepidisphaeraceae bacterium]|nr:protein kinase [Tepidisphaeraceae bacterium]